uniref:Uncharacterized protein n=1 Tax=Myotis myotis TaxID=51298 RepID=A0A7J7ZXN7_MYOMY|nr:hypothetical protein mMyoMyo1_009921 [Myotis myotis]
MEGRGQAGAGPGQSPELGEQAFVRSHAVVGTGDKGQEAHRTPHVPEAWTPEGGSKWNPSRHSPLPMPPAPPRLPPVQAEAQAGQATSVPVEKVEVGPGDRLSSPSTEERKGECPATSETAFLLGPQRSLRERGPLLSWGNSSGQ